MGLIQVRKGLLGLVLLLMPGAGVAQAQSAASAAPVNQGTSPLMFAGEAPRDNLLSVGLSTSGSWDNNPLNATPAQSSAFSSFGTNLAFDVDRPRFSVNLNYSPQYTYSPDAGSYNSMAHVAGATFSYRASHRLAITLRNFYSHTSNPMQVISTTQPTPVFGVVDQVNQTGYGEYLDVTTEQAGADFTYALSPHSSIGIGGGYSGIQSSQPNNANLLSQDVTSWSGHAFYSRQFSRRQTAGLQFSWQRIEALGGANQATPISLQYFHQVQISRGFSFSLFGGPQLTSSVDTVPLASAVGGLPPALATTLVGQQLTIRNRQWMAGGGGTLNWSSARNAASASFVRQTSSGGVFGGIANSWMINGTYRRQLTARTIVNLSTNYTRNDSLDALNPVPLGSYLTASAQVSRNIGPVQFSVSYVRYQTSAGQIPQLAAGDHNQVLLTLSYFFRRALGK